MPAQPSSTGPRSITPGATRKAAGVNAAPRVVPARAAGGGAASNTLAPPVAAAAGPAARGKRTASIGGGEARGRSSAAGSAGGRNATSRSPGHSKHQFDPKNRLGSSGDEQSPRLLHADAGEVLLAAPLLPPMPLATDGAEERFCTEGPDVGGVGQSRRLNSSAASALTFPEIVTRLEAALGQASLLLNDRLQALQIKCTAGATFSRTQQVEFCEIADGIVAAVYHVQKWAHVLDPSGQVHKPAKPGNCEEVDEAFAVVRYALPRLMVSGSQAYKGLTAAVQGNGDGAEARVQALGVPMEDLRAVAPHLERIVMRLGRLSSSLRPARPLREFIVEYFAPTLGRKLAARLLPFLLPEGGKKQHPGVQVGVPRNGR